MTGRRLLACVVIVAVGAGIWWLGSTEENRLFALDAESGRVVWSAGLPLGTRVAGVPAVAGDRVVVGLGLSDALGSSQERWQLSAFDAATGRKLWEYVPPREQARHLYAINMVLATPYATASHVFVRLEGADISSLLALDAATGQTAWTLEEGLAFGHDSRHTDIVASGGRVLVPTSDGAALTLRALDARNGAELWRVPIEQEGIPLTDVGPFFAASADTFYAGLSRGVLALDATTGAVRFRADDPADERGGQIVLDGDTLYRRSGLKMIDALDANTGARRWTYRLDDRSGGLGLKSLAVRGDILAVLCACEDERGRDRGALIAVDTALGTERWRASLDAYIEVYQTWPVQAAQTVVEATEHDDVVGRAAADGSRRWRFPRENGRGVATDDRLVFASDRAPRWHHWLRILGLPVPA